MTQEEIFDAVEALDRWLKSQEITDEYAVIIMSELVAWRLAQNFDKEGAEHVAAAFQKMLNGAIAKYFEGKNEAQRPD